MNIVVEEPLNSNEFLVWNSIISITKNQINISFLDVDKLLFTPILIHKGIDIKFKRTKQLIDKTSFTLKTPITNEKDKIDSSRFELYVTTLVDKNLIDTISDFSSDSEQIMVVQCTSEIGKYSSSIYFSFSLFRFR
jgi:hypothetical protein